MNLKFEVQTKIKKPIAEVYDAVYDNKKLSGYFTTGGSSSPLDEGKKILWKFHDVPDEGYVNVKQSIKNEIIVLECENSEKVMNKVELKFESLDATSTMVRIKESGWQQESQASIDESYSHCMGWTQMLCSLKVYVEYGKNSRQFFF
jgi:uncharacterized protein YndB with AHSA1/START domain